ncbi:phosphate transporter PHO1 homolog 10 [Hibiscus syriacus]|uniref:phosphate transporter PHO1 homolog 10 n=1 Tax=Hibiscus syriacus TaxID=106335 RepID=UPI0019237479|nr:phosphate transporter PHO1 homolog 10 [Hibiscus syriacus]
MKFSKDFKRQMVPEWIEAYVDYDGLKHILREILHYKLSKRQETPMRSLEKKLSLHRTLSGLHRHPNDPRSNGDLENQVTGKGRAIEVEFFRRLDEELNKVNAFYKEQIDAVMDESALLNKQLDALIALRIKVKRSCGNGASSHGQRPRMPFRETEQGMDAISEVEMNTQSPLEVSSNSLSGSQTMNVILDEINQDDESAAASEINTFEQSSNGCQDAGKNSARQQDDPLEILEKVKINNTFESPLETIKGLFKDSKDDELCFKKDELKKAEGKLRVVFIEFYQKLLHLKQYSFMNLSALSKIIKSYQKITSRREARLYMKKIDKSYIGSCDEANNLLEKVEATFIKHFSNSDIQEGMKSLRPVTKKEKHSVTFWCGCFSGFSIALLIAVILRIESKKLMEKEQGASYMVNIFPLYSFFGYIVLQMLTYAADIYFWKRCRINYPFIFGFKSGTQLSYREVILLGTGLAVLALSCFLGNLYLDLGSKTQNLKTLTGLFPLGLVAIVLIILFCPFNIAYRSTRFFFIKSLFRCLCAPLYRVTLPDFFLADHLTSQIQAIRSLDLYICYYGLGERSQRQSKCHGHGVYNALYIVIAVIPYWLRFWQCIRRWFEEKEAMHAYNSINYILTIVAVIIRGIFELKKGMAWIVLSLVSSAVVVVISTYWDIVHDWGLLRRHSKNPYLRDKLLVPYKSVYFAAMALDIVLRVSWMQLVLEFNLHSLHRMAVTTVVSCLEIVRRGMWSFFRIENEHLNNVGMYRAFKSVPLPFNYNDGEEEEGSRKDD